jgi:hypothetical protein
LVDSAEKAKNLVESNDEQAAGDGGVQECASGVEPECQKGGQNR